MNKPSAPFFGYTTENLPPGAYVFNRDGSLNLDATDKLQKLIDDGQQILFSEWCGCDDERLES